MKRSDLLLYAVTDRSWLGERTLYEAVEEALIGGATMIQLREKDLPREEFLAEAVELCRLCRRFSVPFIVNDSVDIAAECGADGVHIGQSDDNAAHARRLLGPDKIIGVSAQTVEQARAAEAAGADYLGVGAVFSTSTKLDAADVSLQTLKDICSAVSIPAVAIGGINSENILTLKGSGIAGAAVVSAIFAQEDIRKASQRLAELAKML